MSRATGFGIGFGLRANIAREAVLNHGTTPPLGCCLHRNPQCISRCGSTKGVTSEALFEIQPYRPTQCTDWKGFAWLARRSLNMKNTGFSATCRLLRYNRLNAIENRCQQDYLVSLRFTSGKVSNSLSEKLQCLLITTRRTKKTTTVPRVIILHKRSFGSRNLRVAVTRFGSKRVDTSIGFNKPVRAN